MDFILTVVIVTDTFFERCDGHCWCCVGVLLRLGCNRGYSRRVAEGPPKKRGPTGTGRHVLTVDVTYELPTTKRPLHYKSQVATALDIRSLLHTHDRCDGRITREKQNRLARENLKPRERRGHGRWSALVKKKTDSAGKILLLF